MTRTGNIPGNPGGKANFYVESKEAALEKALSRAKIETALINTQRFNIDTPCKMIYKMRYKKSSSLLNCSFA